MQVYAAYPVELVRFHPDGVTCTIAMKGQQVATFLCSALKKPAGNTLHSIDPQEDVPMADVFIKPEDVTVASTTQ